MEGGELFQLNREATFQLRLSLRHISCTSKSNILELSPFYFGESGWFWIEDDRIKRPVARL